MSEQFKYKTPEEYQRLTPAQREEYWKQAKKDEDEMDKTLLGNLNRNVKAGVRTP